MATEITQAKTPDRLIDAAWRRIAQKPENLNRRDDFQPCYICGRPVDTTKSAWIHVIEGGGYAADDEEESRQHEGTPGDVGLHCVGTDCLRRHRPKLWAVPRETRAAGE